GHYLLLRARLRLTRRTAETDAAGAAELLQTVRADELFERVDLLRRADELEDDRVRAEIGDARAENLSERHQLGALARRRRDLEQGELALDRLAGRELLHAQHVHEFVHLLLDLFERVMLAVDTQGDARDLVPLGRTD